jgi:hypothetical protein
MERGEGEEAEQEADPLRHRDRLLQRQSWLDPRELEGPSQHVSIKRGRPVVEHAPALADRGVVAEEALNVVLDRPLAPRHGCSHFEIVTTVAGDERQVSPGDPDHRADRVA